MAGLVRPAGFNDAEKWTRGNYAFGRRMKFKLPVPPGPNPGAPKLTGVRFLCRS